jgi:DNA-binding CsgD family transcriptional regulator
MGMPEAATFAEALDCLGAGLFLVEETSRIVHANASAQAMLDRRSVLRAVEGRLVACEARSARALKDCVAEVAGGAAPGATAGARAIAVALRASDGAHCIAHVLPLALGSQRSYGHGAGAALLVHKIALEVPPPPAQAIAALYGLTPSELRVLTAIVEVGGVRETAEALGIGEATVKTHLHRLFGKTGTTRQADLVKLVAGFASPVAAPLHRCQPAGVGRSAEARPPCSRDRSRRATLMQAN